LGKFVRDGTLLQIPTLPPVQADMTLSRCMNRNGPAPSVRWVLQRVNNVALPGTVVSSVSSQCIWDV